MEFDCRDCVSKKRHLRSVCFHKSKKIWCRIPVFDESGNVFEWLEREMTKEDMVEHLTKVCNLLPSALIIDLLKHKLMQVGKRGEFVCPMGLFTEEADWLVSLETAASKYHVLPYPGEHGGAGSYLEQPLFIIEAFDTARSAEAKYTNYKMSKITDNKNQKGVPKK